MARLGTICSDSIETLKPSYRGYIDYIDISSIDNKLKRIVSTQRILANEAPSRAKQIVQKGDILISTVRPNLNAVAFVDEDYNMPVASTGYCVLRCNDSIDKRYVFHYCQSQHFVDVLSAQAAGASYPAVSNAIVKNTEIPLPTLHQQTVISQAFDQIDSLISLRKKQLQKLDDLVKSRFVEMFGDPAQNTMGLPVKTLPEISDNLDSRRIPITSSDRKAGVFPYYGASGIVDYVENYIFDEDILLVSEDGANLLARVTPIAFSVSGKVWVNNHAHVIRFTDKAMQIYVEHLLNMIDISSFVTGTAQPKLNQAKMNSIPIPMPMERSLQAFLEFVKQNEKTKLTVQQGLDKLELLKQSLMQKCFG